MEDYLEAILGLTIAFCMFIYAIYNYKTG